MNGNSTIAPLEILIRAQKFDQVNPEITNELFPIPDRVWNNYVEFHFGEFISSEEAVERIRAEGYEPANSHELLLWNRWNGENPVIALGSLTKIDGRKKVLSLHSFWSRRCLDLILRDNIWIAYRCHFLGVRKPPGS